MISKDYVSFETAKLLKEKGFNEYYPLWYNLDKPIEGPFFYKEIGWYGHNSYDYNGKRIVSAPTLQMAMKWLRETHGIYIKLDFVVPEKIWAVIYYDNKTFTVDNDDENYSTYEAAYEDAIQFCLKELIK